jgi:hypothetical protein
MSMLRKYFDDAERRYNYRIKSVVELDDHALDAIENVVLKYNPFDMTQVSKTILHRNPLDFPNISAAEVYSVDICLGLPASPSVLRREIAFALGVSDGEVMVRGENDPTEIETQRIDASEDMTAEAKGDEAAALIDTGLDYPEANEVDGKRLYGNEYNGRLVSMLKQIADERKTVVRKSHDYPDVKSDVKDDQGPLPALGDIEHVETSKHGNLDDNTKVYKRVYKNGRVVSKDGVAVKRGK